MPRFQHKLTQGRPIQVWVNRQSGATDPPPPDTVVTAPQINVWPTPDGSQTYQFVYWRMRRIQDSGNGVASHKTFRFDFLPALYQG
jgi:hypothetical protein